MEIKNNNQTITIIKSERKVIYFITDEQQIKKEGEVVQDEKPLTSLYKNLLLDENLRENYLKGIRRIKLASSVLNEPFFISPNPLPFAEELIGGLLR